jgi:hypothetical protein
MGYYPWFFWLVLCYILFIICLIMGFKILRWAIWLLPLYLAYQLAFQSQVLHSLQQTYNTGEQIVATVEDFRIKQIASQTNGYVVLSFTTSTGETINRRLSLPVQLAAPIQNMALINIRYRSGVNQEIVMTPNYRFHRNMVIMNIGILVISTLITVLIAIWATSFANKKIKDPDEPKFQRVDV